MGAIAVTGAAGFVGRRLVEALKARGERVVAIARRPAPADWPADFTWVEADLLAPEKYQDALKDVDCVVHLAATTGKARPAVYWRGNVEATEALIGACKGAGVGRLVFVSSIAASYADRRFYPYAESKIAAEVRVREAGIPFVIVRPTLVMGEGSPVQASLEKLAGAPVIPVFGDGKKKTQPVDVDVVAELLAFATRDADIAGETLEVGGPDVLSMNELLARIRADKGKPGAPRYLHLPLGLVRHSLAMVEGVLFPMLPFTAGQMASFANDGTAAPHAAVARFLAQRDGAGAARAT